MFVCKGLLWVSIMVVCKFNRLECVVGEGITCVLLLFGASSTIYMIYPVLVSIGISMVGLCKCIGVSNLGSWSREVNYHDFLCWLR